MTQPETTTDEDRAPAWADVLAAREHRDEPPPARRHALSMRWHGLLFAHWPVPVARVRAAVPAPLALDLRDGEAWVGLVPFLNTHVALAGLSPVPSLSTFPQLNARTYVTHRGRRGVFFLSVEVTNWLAAQVARRGFQMAYHWARIHRALRGDAVWHASERRRGPAARVEVRYAPSGPARRPARASFEHWLLERYCFFTVGPRGEVHRGEIHHAPWAVQPAEAEFVANDLAARALGAPLEGAPPVLHFAPRMDALAWALEPA